MSRGEHLCEHRQRRVKPVRCERPVVQAVGDAVKTVTECAQVGVVQSVGPLAKRLIEEDRKVML